MCTCIFEQVIIIHTFFQLPHLDCLTPHASVCLPRLCLSPSTVTWGDTVRRWLLKQPAETTSYLEPLMQRLLPPCLEFLAPILCADGREDRKGGGVSSQQSASSLGATQSVHLSPQVLKLHPIHLVTTCCRILEVSAVISVFICV